MTESKIETRKNGPLIAKGITRMVAADGTDADVKPVMGLCRCGASKNKPFCDGSHVKMGFDSAQGTPAGKDKLLTYKGAEISVTYNPMLCSHAAECGRLAGHVFNPAQKPWVQPDQGTTDEIRAVVAACPSGALALVGKNDEVEHLFAPDADIQIEQHGPYWIQNVAAPEEAHKNAGVGSTLQKYVLCRCGKSGNKPYCDGAHRDAGWRDDE